ncbi:MAG: type II toxin-antitoxin system VapC family toxin [Promethearchaeota archaeon]
MIIILDTNFLFALKSKKDQYHEKAYKSISKMNEENTKYFTTYSVMSETLTLAIKRSHGNIFFLEKYITLFLGNDNFFNIVQCTPQEFTQIIEIYKKYVTPKRLLSFTDASLIYLYQKLKADYILSFDSHFDNILNRRF